MEGLYNSCTTQKSEIEMVRQMLEMKNEKLNEKGIALVMVLILSAIALAIMAALVYMLISGTQISGMQKRYRTALEAGVGGADVDGVCDL